ncbi:MAG: hypothetical protein P9L92_20570, partial [Candidatus Electryonea clarkiae]|nr:hypothetical protein [Candidatus Electryonea clarkiae]
MFNTDQSGEAVSDAMEGSRRLTGIASETSAISSSTPSDPEVPSKPVRRRFSKAYKLRILKEYDSCTKPGEKSALLRREGLYSQSIAVWRHLRDEGKLEPSSHSSGKQTISASDRKRLMELELENERLHKELSMAQKIIEAQKKIQRYFRSR